MIEGLARERALGIPARTAEAQQAVNRTTAVVQVGALVLVSSALWSALAMNMAGPWVVPDEFIYAALAKSIAAGHLPSLRGVTTFGYGVGYPALLAPAWLLGAGSTVAYKFTLVTNAALMSSSAVPAYLLARRFVSHAGSLAVASLTVLVPAMAFTSMVLTENAYYPAFLLALLAIVRALEKPTRRRQCTALGAIALAVSMKLLGVVLAPVFLTAVVVDALLCGGGAELRSRLRSFRPAFVVIAVAIGAAVALSAAAGRGAAGALGAYGAVLSRFDLGGIPWAFVLHVAALDLTSGFVPFAATAFVVALTIRRRFRDPEAVRFSALALSTSLWLPLTIAFSAGAIRAGSAGAGAQAHLHERYLFTAAPLLLVGLAIVVERRLSRRTTTAIALAVVSFVLAAIIPVAHLSENAALQAPSLILWLLFAHGQVALGVAAACVLAAFVLTPMRRTAVPWGSVVVLFLGGAFLASAASFGKGEAVTAAGTGSDHQWVDRVAGASGNVAVLWNEPGSAGTPAPPRAAQDVVWVDEFFNRSIRRVLALGAPNPEGLTERRVEISSGGLLRDVRGTPATAQYVLTCGMRLAAPVAARDADTGARLYRVDGPIRVVATGRSTCVGRKNAVTERGRT